VMEFYTTTMKVLGELGAGKRPMLIAFNKVAKIADSAALRGLASHFPEAMFISVHTGEGLPVLLERMSELAAPGTLTRELAIPASESGLLARLHREAHVHEVRYEGEEALVL